MTKRWCVTAGVLLALLAPGPVRASVAPASIAPASIAPASIAPAPPQLPASQGDSVWQGTFWNNTTLTGAPVFQRDDAVLDFDWGLVSPSPALNVDEYSARWTRSINVAAGMYRFRAQSDDGVRVYVDGQLIIDKWYAHPPQTFTADQELVAGSHQIVVEFYEQTGRARIAVSWAPLTVTVNNWRGEYYNNMTLIGTPALVRDDPQINFTWGEGPPGQGVNADAFSARWTRAVNLSAGVYRFQMTVDDGGRLWVNNQLVLDEWRMQGARTFSADVSVQGGATQIRMEHYEDSGNASAALTWERAPVASGWRGEYFNNAAVSGQPVLTRNENEINFDWGVGSPAQNTVVNDGFSARWTRTLNAAAGWYRFTMAVDDGGRLWVGDRLVLDAWQVQTAAPKDVDLYLSGGATALRMEYYENAGLASARLTWATLEQTIRNWRAEFYNNVTLGGSPVLVRDDAQIDFNWQANSPAPGSVDADRFSARWTRSVSLEPGWYRFNVVVDDGARLWVNDQLIIDAWQVQGQRPYSADVYVPGQSAAVKLEYFEDAGWATIQLAWERISAPPQASSVVVDDTDGGFVRAGVESEWNVASEGQGNRLVWTRNTSRQTEDTPRASWYPRLKAGSYEVFAYIPDRYTTTRQAVYVISHASGRTQRLVSQASNADRWVSLGVYAFTGSADDFVSLSSLTGERSGSTLVCFDAVKWEARP